jgi:hypothetical protein
VTGTGWGSSENEVEMGFNYAQPALDSKGLNGSPSGFRYLSAGYRYVKIILSALHYE